MAIFSHNKINKVKLPEVIILKDKNKIKEYLNNLLQQGGIIAFDIETSGLKPYNKGHFIYSFGFCDNDLKPVSFLYSSELRRYLKRIFTNKNIKLIAHNIAFEHLWVKTILNIEITNWYWDTCTTQHIYDNNSKVGLKYLLKKYLKYPEYDSSIGKYLKAENSNSINNIKKAPINELLEYNGIDAEGSFRLYELQKEKMQSHDLEKPRKFFLDCSINLCDVSSNGMPIDIIKCKENKIILQNEIDECMCKIKKAHEYKLWYNKYNRSINLDSNDQLADILFNELKLKPIKKTDKGNNAVDTEALEQIDLEFVQLLLHVRKLQKAKNTYLENIITETNNDNKLRCSYNISNVSSYRSSSNMPNLQNIPIRNKKIGPLIRDCFIPEKGHHLLEVDFKALEVSVGCFYHKDPQMIKYLTDDSADMHLDMACEIFKLKPEQVAKEIRFYTKNCFVFPSFYGSYWEQIAPNIWKNVIAANLKTKEDVYIQDHLKEFKLNTYDNFAKHIKNIESDFWNKRFKTYNKWKKDLIKSYDKYHSMRSLLGFRYIGSLKRNQITNFPIQGLACHILLTALLNVNNYLKENKYKTKIINQIHDSLIISLDPNEKDIILPKIKYLMTEKIREQYKFVNIPLVVEFEITNINESWNNKKEIVI